METSISYMYTIINIYIIFQIYIYLYISENPGKDIKPKLLHKADIWHSKNKIFQSDNSYFSK